MHPLLPPVLALPLLAQVTLSHDDARVQSLTKAKDWPALADFIETLSPKERGRFLIPWMTSLHRADRHERSLAVCEAVLSQLKDPRDPQVALALEFKARSLGSLGQNAEAAQAWEALGMLPGKDSNLDNAVVEARNAKDWKLMARVAQARAERTPVMKPFAEGWLGEALARQDRFEEAEPILRAAVQAQPNQPFAWTNLARCLNEKKAFEDAFEACSQALSRDPKLMEALYNRGRAAFELKRYPQAVEDFRAALLLLPEDLVLKENLRQAERYANPRGIKAKATR
jgi:tetratricopeptide (TPR) repeat protein